MKCQSGNITGSLLDSKVVELALKGLAAMVKDQSFTNSTATRPEQSRGSTDSGQLMDPNSRVHSRVAIRLFIIVT